jgi:hypothetical protein
MAVIEVCILDVGQPLPQYRVHCLLHSGQTLITVEARRAPMVLLELRLHKWLSQQPLNAGHADIEMFGQLTRRYPLLVARDKATYVRLAQPITDPPNTRSLLGTDATHHARLTNTLTA